MRDIGTQDTQLPPTAPGGSSNPAEVSPDPTRIGRYTVLERLGKGGMGVVYAAYDPELDRKIAIKLLFADIEPEQRRRSQELLRREAQALAKLAHPNIVAIHDVGAYAGQVFVAMEFVSGSTMRQWWEQRTPGWQDVLAAMVQAGRGLVAAHAVSLIHRDIKPDNLLIGEDGRVRVADFGIARHGPSADEVTAAAPDRGHTLATIGPRGTVIGTPAYMPPEQHDGGEVGPYSDQFSFCVTLWEGLHGQRPFVGDARELPELIRAGVPTRPAGAPELPAWLDRALRRGLSPQPAERWPSMQALLDVLELDFDARRVRRNRRLLSAALAVIGGIALVLGARALQAAWYRRALERAAAERLVGVGEDVARMLALGARKEAEEALRVFVEEPELRGSSAVIDAWLLWADAMDRLDDRAAAQTAVVEACAALPEDDPREPAIALRIARLFHGARQFEPLAALAEQVAGRWPDAVRTPVWTDLRADAALGRGDLVGFVAAVDAGAPGREHAALAPVLRALASARCPIRGPEMVASPTDWPGDERRELMLHERGRPVGTGSMRRMDPALTPVGPDLKDIHFFTLRTHPQPLVRSPGGPAYVLAYDAARNEGILHELAADGVRERLRLPDEKPWITAAADLDGDGRRELYVGTAAYARKLHRLEPDAAGIWRARPAHPPTDAMASDIHGLAAGDFDGDGREELAVAVGAWRAYDVRILEAGPDGELRLALRRRVGHVHELASLRGADGATLLAFSKDDIAPSRDAWPPGEPQGEPAGLHVVRRRGDRLEPVTYVPWPSLSGGTKPPYSTTLAVGDFDGDGLHDLAAEVGNGDISTSVLLLVRQLSDGSFVSATIGGAFPQVAGNFDRDPADELLVHVLDGDAHRLCVLGVDGEPFATPPAPHRIADAPALADPLLARAWARTENLAGFGLYGAAARALERRVAMTEHEADGRALRRRAAELYESAGEFVRAGEHFAALAEQGDIATALRAAADFEQGLRMADALRIVEEALARGAATADQTRELQRARARLAALEGRTARMELAFDRPLTAEWDVVEPLALRLDPIRDDLIVEATSDMQTLVSLPIELTGEPLTIELDIDADRMEWATDLALEVLTPDGKVVTMTSVSAGGGGGYLWRRISFAYSYLSDRESTPAERTTHRIRVTTLPDNLHAHAVLTGSHPYESVLPISTPIRPGPHRLVLRAAGVEDHASQQLRVRIHRIALIGAHLVESADSQRGRLARAVVAGEWHEVLAADADAAERRLWRGVAFAQLGRSGEAVAAFGALDPDDPAIRRQLRLLLKTDPVIFAPVLRAALGPRYPALLLESLRREVEHPDDELTTQRLATTTDLEQLPDRGDAAALATRAGLFALRGVAWKSVGRLAQAEADLALAAALMERSLPHADAADPALATIELRRAEIAAIAERATDAFAAAGRALRRATDPAWTAERLQISPAFAPLRADPRWQALLAAEN